VAQRNEVAIEERSLSAIAQASEGSMRDALSMLDQAVAFGGKTIRDQDVEEMLGSVPDELVRRLVETTVHQNPAAALELIGEVIDHGYDLRTYCGAVVKRTRNLMIAAIVPGPEQAEGLMDLPNEEVQHLMTEAKSFSIEQLQELFQLFAQTEDRLRATTHQRFAFEVAAVRAARLFQHKPTPSQPQPASSSRNPQANTTSNPQSKTQNKMTSAINSDPLKSRPTQPDRKHKVPSTITQRELDTAQKPPQKSDGGRQTSVSPRLSDEMQGLPIRPHLKPSPPKSGPSLATTPAIQPEDWHKVVEAMIKNFPNIGTFLEMSVLVKVEGNQVIIGFPKTASVACSRIQKEENRLLVSQVCQDIIGASVQLRVVELTESQEDGLTMKQVSVQKKTQDEKTLLEEARANPLVKQAMKLFGGEVIKASRKVENKET